MSKRKKDKLATASFLSILLLIIGVALVILYIVLPYFKTDDARLWSQMCLWVGVALTMMGLIVVFACIRSYRRADELKAKEKAQKLSTNRGDGGVNNVDEPHSYTAQPTSGNTQVIYIPNREAYEYMNVGNYQSLDDKFDQIARMDKTQFVIYMARLFSLKGYQVKLTPVMDNRDIDLLVEKMGVTIAVGCLLSNRILYKEDLVRIKHGKQYYGVCNCMALTNMYFDRSAIEYAKAERMSLVDRNVLANEFLI